MMGFDAAGTHRRKYCIHNFKSKTIRGRREKREERREKREERRKKKEKK